MPLQKWEGVLISPLTFDPDCCCEDVVVPDCCQQDLPGGPPTSVQATVTGITNRQNPSFNCVNCDLLNKVYTPPGGDCFNPNEPCEWYEEQSNPACDQGIGLDWLQVYATRRSFLAGTTGFTFAFDETQGSCTFRLRGRWSRTLPAGTCFGTWSLTSADETNEPPGDSMNAICDISNINIELIFT